MYVGGLRSFGLLVAVSVLVVCSLGSVAAEHHWTINPDLQLRSYGTANLPPAIPWAADETLVWGEVRMFGGSDHTLSAGLRAGVGEGSEGQFTVIRLEGSGEDAAGNTIKSTGTLIGLDYKWLAHQDERMTVSVVPGLEYPIERLKSENQTIGGSATSDRFIPVFSVPLEWQLENGTILSVVPRYVGFDSAPRNWRADGTQDGTVDGFGQVIAIGVGVLHQDIEYSLMADLQVPIAGDNSIDIATNTPTREIVWSAGGSWHGDGSSARVDLFATNAFGPTAASSMMATADNNVGFGLRVSGEF